MSIIASHISYSIGHNTILSDISLNAQSGDFIALTGPSGCGKTTLLSILGLLIRPEKGEVKINHRGSWSAENGRSFWRDRAAFIYQDYGVIDDESIAYNITLSHSKKVLNPSTPTGAKLHKILGSVGLDKMATLKAAVLSGGEKQRVGIARALWKDAKYIFADEPTASLDLANKELLLGLLQEATRNGSCVIVATHDDFLIQHCTKHLDLSQNTHLA